MLDRPRIIQAKAVLDLIRHPESEANREKDRVGGRQNLADLTARGVLQAETLRDMYAYAGLVPEAIYRSPLLRAARAVEIHLKHRLTKSPIYVMDEWTELYNGAAEGCHKRLVYTPQVVRAYQENPGGFAHPHGESIDAVTSRVGLALTQFKWDVENREPLHARRNQGVFYAQAFTHKGAINGAIRWIYGLHGSVDTRWLAHYIGNSTVTRVAIDEIGGWHILFIGRRGRTWLRLRTAI